MNNDINNDLYLLNLIEQYKRAKGIEKIDLESVEFLKEFNIWRSKRQGQCNGYLSTLEYMGINYDDRKCAEIDKGKYDSTIIPYETTIITPFADTKLKYSKEKKVIKSEFRVLNGAPALVQYCDGTIIDAKLIKPEQVTTYMTQNPYRYGMIKNWSELHNNRHNNIIVGVYGYNDDKDKNQKISMIEDLRTRLINCYVEEYTTIGDQYFYVIATNKEEKVKRLKRQ